MEPRLFKIKNSGQSKNLYKLVSQLPKSNRWDIWKKWQIEYELINRKDEKACKFINVESKSNVKNFWQMARIFCLSIEGKRDQSEFVLDLIKSRGFNDEIFEDLFESIYNEVNVLNIENKKNKIQPLHIVMMDTLKIPIKTNYIAHLGIEYTDSLLSLNYLTSKARAFLLDKQLNYSFVSVDQIIENYKSVANGNIDFEKSFSNFLKSPLISSRRFQQCNILLIVDFVSGRICLNQAMVFILEDVIMVADKQAGFGPALFLLATHASEIGCICGNVGIVSTISITGVDSPLLKLCNL